MGRVMEVDSLIFATQSLKISLPCINNVKWEGIGRKLLNLKGECSFILYEDVNWKGK
jgi:hypothetical protein